MHRESNNYISSIPNRSSVSNTAPSTSISRVNTLPNTYTSSLAGAVDTDNTTSTIDNASARAHTSSLLASSSLVMQDKWNAQNNSRMSLQVDESKIKTTNKKKKKKTIATFFKNIFKSKDKTNVNNKKVVN